MSIDMVLKYWKGDDWKENVARRTPGGQYSSIWSTMPWPSGPGPEQLCTQARNGHVPASTPSVPRSMNFHEYPMGPSAKHTIGEKLTTSMKKQRKPPKNEELAVLA